MENNNTCHEQNQGQPCQSGGCSCGSAGEKSVTQAEVAKPAVRRPVYVPAVDLIDSEGEVVLLADVAGVGEGGVDLTVDKNILTLVAKPAEQTVAGGKLVYSEYGVGEYRRSFAISAEIDKGGISAALKDGVLRIRLPKTPAAVKKISVAAE